MDRAAQISGPIGRLADRAYSYIVGLIEAERLIIGDRLPSETKLAIRFGMSRTIVREALVRLAADGITEARRGSGSFVKAKPSDRLAAHMPIAEMASTLGTYEVRFVLETEAARLAALRRSDADMVAIEIALADLRAALLSDRPAHAEDMALHRQIIAAAANPAFCVAYEPLEIGIDRIMRAGVDIARRRSPIIIDAMIREHTTIVAAIRACDADAASLSMRWHLFEGRKRLMP